MYACMLVALYFKLIYKKVLNYQSVHLCSIRMKKKILQVSALCCTVLHILSSTHKAS